MKVTYEIQTKQKDEQMKSKLLETNIQFQSNLDGLAPGKF
jgi:hypothetical protein